MNDYFERVNDVCTMVDEKEISQLLDILEKAYYRKQHIFICGNGGSGATASHLAEDLAKGTLNGNIHRDGLRFKAISLTDNTPFILALANDVGYDSIFEQQLRTYAEPNDVVIAISGSGNSPNIIKAVDYANRRCLVTVGMTGFDGGKLREMALHTIHVPVDDMGMTEAVHGIIVHYIVDQLREKLASGYRYVERVSTTLEQEMQESRLVNTVVFK
ncbi:SIS domain-containing protein [candidate division KSB1 bacterium]|nr:SIS domain-containing protein [candidate division KSB1 bacterium]